MHLLAARLERPDVCVLSGGTCFSESIRSNDASVDGQSRTVEIDGRNRGDQDDRCCLAFEWHLFVFLFA